MWKLDPFFYYSRLDFLVHCMEARNPLAILQSIIPSLGLDLFMPAGLIKTNALSPSTAYYVKIELRKCHFRSGS